MSLSRLCFCTVTAAATATATATVNVTLKYEDGDNTQAIPRKMEGKRKEKAR
jgi:hypothetical protein